MKTDPEGKAPMNWGDAAGWVSLLAYADLLLLAKSEDYLRQMHRELLDTCRQLGLRFREGRV